jgi:hypothetical protein
MHRFPSKIGSGLLITHEDRRSPIVDNDYTSFSHLGVGFTVKVIKVKLQVSSLARDPFTALGGAIAMPWKWYEILLAHV